MSSPTKPPAIFAPTMAPKRSSSDLSHRRRTTIRSFTIFLFLVLLWQIWSFSSRVESPTSSTSPTSSSSPSPSTPSDCPQDLSSLFIVLQTPPNTMDSTTTTTAQHQQDHNHLSEIHYATTLRCIPHYGVFTPSTPSSLASRALAAAPPSTAWFVFLPPTTHILWPNLLAHLAHFSSPRADSWYLGAPALAGAHVVAAPAAGTVVSRAAMLRIASSDPPTDDEEDEEDVMEALGRALLAAGVELTWAWPGMQPLSPSSLDWSEERSGVGRLWCHRAISYGGLTGEELARLDAVERAASADGTPLTRHRDVFQDFVLARLASTMPRWDNGASRATFRKLTRKGLRAGKPIASFADCRLECDQYGSCVGFAWVGRECRFSTKFQLGQRNETVTRELTSGFMMDRVDWMVRGWEDEPCRVEEEWTLPWQVDLGVESGDWED